jgi:hypothetical protein
MLGCCALVQRGRGAVALAEPERRGGGGDVQGRAEQILWIGAKAVALARRGNAGSAEHGAVAGMDDHFLPADP